MRTHVLLNRLELQARAAMAGQDEDVGMLE